MICPRCSEDNPEDAKECADCGRDLEPAPPRDPNVQTLQETGLDVPKLLTFLLLTSGSIVFCWGVRNFLAGSSDDFKNSMTLMGMAWVVVLSGGASHAYRQRLLSLATPNPNPRCAPRGPKWPSAAATIVTSTTLAYGCLFFGSKIDAPPSAPPNPVAGMRDAKDHIENGAHLHTKTGSPFGVISIADYTTSKGEPAVLVRLDSDGSNFVMKRAAITQGNMWFVP